MEATFFSIMTIGFMLGIKHAVEPDHVIAVSTIASQTKKLSRSALAGVYWGIGHTVTLFIIGMTVIFLKGEIPESWAMSLEFLVGIMLIYLGLTSFIKIKNLKTTTHTHPHIREHHTHTHPGYSADHRHLKTSYLKSMIIGMVHGLAGSAAMILLTMSTVESVWQGGIYILIFGIGTILGMMISTSLIGLPFVLSTKKETLNTSLTALAGAVSTVFGFYYIYNLGINEGLFMLWF